jgi:hypothetical protein
MAESATNKKEGKLWIWKMKMGTIGTQGRHAS